MACGTAAFQMPIELASGLARMFGSAACPDLAFVGADTAKTVAVKKIRKVTRIWPLLAASGLS
jgi:hypothetical protein